jgi:hypothetical protein
MRFAFAMLLSLSAVAAVAGDGAENLAGEPTPAASETLSNLFGGEVEARLDVDFNGDGHADTAVVMRDADHESRGLHVLIGYADAGGTGHEPIDGVALDPYPLGTATLAYRKGVLIVEDLTGGTTAIASTYRWRYDPEEHRMRLIGDDVSLYSRTNAHDALEISTNRLTGLRLRRVMKRVDEPAADGAAYDPQPEIRESVPTTPIHMAESPAPAETLGLDAE